MMEDMEKTTVSVIEMGRMLGLRKTESYRLWHMAGFKTVKIGRSQRIDLKSFEEWYRNQTRYAKVNGPPPGENLRSWSYTVEEAASLLGMKKSYMYEIIRKGKLPAVTAGGRLRIEKDAFELWYIKQHKYVKIADRPPETPMKPPKKRIDMNKDSFTAEEAALILKLDVNDIYAMIRRGELEALSAGRKKMIEKAEIEWLLLAKKLNDREEDGGDTYGIDS